MSQEHRQITPADELLNDFDGGLFVEKVSRALADVAEGVVANGRAGQVTVTMDLKQIAEASQVNVKHQVKYTVPTRRGKSTEEDTTSTPLYVGRRGKLTFMPDTQIPMPGMGKTAGQTEE